MPGHAHFLLSSCRRRRAEVARGRLMAIGLALGAIVTGVALSAQPLLTPAPGLFLPHSRALLDGARAIR
jgi:hypothetical protein